MEQTVAHEQHNADLLALIPRTSREIVEIGCSSGSLAREFKKLANAAFYTGIEIDPEYSVLARRHCDRVLNLDIEAATSDYLKANVPGDCWVFGDTLEHLRDPWALLARIRTIMPPAGSVVACIPNAQHWSVQALLSIGRFRYQDSGLLDRTHLRWFTRITINEMFEGCGFRIVEERSRIFQEPARERILPFIRATAAALGADADQAVTDAIPMQYLVHAVAA